MGRHGVLLKERRVTMEDIEMLYLKAKEQQYKDWLYNQKFYEIFELPFILNKIEVQIEKTKLSDLRTNGSDDSSSHTTEEIF